MTDPNRMILLAFCGGTDTLLSAPKTCVFFPRAIFSVCTECTGTMSGSWGKGTY